MAFRVVISFNYYKRVEDFHLLDDTSTHKRACMKLHHQQRAQLKNSNQGVDLFFGENNNYHQLGNGFFGNDGTLRKNSGDFIIMVDGKIVETIRIVNFAYAYTFSMAALSTSGKEIEQNNYFGHVSKIKRFLTSRDADFLSYFDKIDESQAWIKGSSLNQILFDNHEEVADKTKIKGHLFKKHVFGFCKTFKKT